VAPLDPPPDAPPEPPLELAPELPPEAELALVPEPLVEPLEFEPVVLPELPDAEPEVPEPLAVPLDPPPLSSPVALLEVPPALDPLPKPPLSPPPVPDDPHATTSTSPNHPRATFIAPSPFRQM
jgi:hypothetical protein